MRQLLLILLFAFHSQVAFAVQIKYATDSSTGRCVSADKADKKNGPFTCLECKGELILRQGQVLAAHFAHKSDPNSECHGGGPETFEHIRAKELLADHLRQWTFREDCKDCKKLVKNTRFLSAEDTASIEFPYDRFVVDVMVLRSGQPVAALEVRNTHAVDDNKRAFFAARNIPIIEVDAHQILRAHARGVYIAIVLEAGQCTPCLENEQQRNRRPCLQCNRWQDKALFAAVVATPALRFKIGFICHNCITHCPTCQKTLTKDERRRNDDNCPSCNREKQMRNREIAQRVNRWKQAVAEAQKHKDFQSLAELICTAPPNVVGLQALRIEADDLREEYKIRIEAEQLARQQQIMRERAELQRQQEATRVRQEKQAAERLQNWRDQIQVARDTQSVDYFLELIASAPAGTTELAELQHEGAMLLEQQRIQEAQEREFRQHEAMAQAAQREAMLYAPLPNPPILVTRLAAPRANKRRKMAGDVETNSRKITEFFGLSRPSGHN